MSNSHEHICLLRALEPYDVETLYLWENDSDVWRVSGSTAPVSRERLMHFIEEQNYDIYATRQMRLVIEHEGVAVGSLDILDFDPQHLRFGLGILIYDSSHRRQGYARSAIEQIKEYGRQTLGLHQIWTNVAADNVASRRLFEQCGFEQCGLKREWLRRDEGYVDQVEYQCIL